MQLPDACGGLRTQRRRWGQHSSTRPQEDGVTRDIQEKGRHFRTSTEGCISVMLREPGMKRCLAERRERFEILVGALFSNRAS